MQAKVTLSAITLVSLACASAAPTLQERMFGHFGRAGQIQTAIIAGNLDWAQRQATWLAEHEMYEGLPAGSEGWVSVVKGAAREVGRAESIEIAAEAVSRLAAGCAGCHRSVDDGPQFRWLYEPPLATDRVSHMMRHLWAMDRMWEGLIGASTETWAAGADAIADGEPETDFPGGAEIAALAAQVHQQAGVARGATESERPDIYAAMLKNCAACHERLGVTEYTDGRED